MTPHTFNGMPVPWNASWTGEASYGIKPCRWAHGAPAMWQRFAPGVGRPVFAKPHFQRQRQSIMEKRCTVCGERTSPLNRWWFGHGALQDGYFMTTEAPVHRACADFALIHCPVLKAAARPPTPFPPGESLISVMIGGAEAARDFNMPALAHRSVCGALKFGWPIRNIEGHVL